MHITISPTVAFNNPELASPNPANAEHPAPPPSLVPPNVLTAAPVTQLPIFLMSDDPVLPSPSPPTAAVCCLDPAHPAPAPPCPRAQWPDRRVRPRCGSMREIALVSLFDGIGTAYIGLRRMRSAGLLDCISAAFFIELSARLAATVQNHWDESPLTAFVARTTSLPLMYATSCVLTRL